VATAVPVVEHALITAQATDPALEELLRQQPII
jgi:hypothetical protein